MATANRKIARTVAAAALVIVAILFDVKISAFSSLSEADAKSWLRFSDWILIGSAILVFIGLAGEFSDSEVWKKTVWYEAAKWAVIAGIFFELLGDASVFKSGDRVTELQDKEIITSRIEAKQADLRAITAQLALVKVLAPRNLSDDAIKHIVEKLKPLGPQPFTYSVSMAMEEGSGLPKQLGTLLIKDCAWEMYKQPPGRVLYRGMDAIGAAFGAGVVITYDGNNAVLRKAAETLAEALGDEEIAARAEPDDPNNPKAIEIAIGTKPLFLREVENLLLGLPPEGKH